MTDGLLEALLERVERYGKPGTADMLQPGLADEEIDELIAPIGLSLPEEARVLWRWRNGGPPRATVYVEYRLLPLSDALAFYREQLDMAAEHAEDVLDPDGWWPKTFFPLVYSEDLLAIDCADPAARFSPVHSMATHDWHAHSGANPETRSIGELITWWIEAYDRGLWRFDADAQSWRLDESKGIFERRHVT